MEWSEWRARIGNGVKMQKKIKKKKYNINNKPQQQTAPIDCVFILTVKQLWEIKEFIPGTE